MEERSIMILKKIPITIVLISLVVVISSCSTGVMSPDDGDPTMAQTYSAAVDEQNTFAVAETTPQAAISGLPMVAINKPIQPISSTLDSQFPTLANPQNVMYIFGHYAGDEQLPVPGHFTAFPMYLEMHYAIPSEIMQPYNDGQFSGENADA